MNASHPRAETVAMRKLKVGKPAGEKSFVWAN